MQEDQTGIYKITNIVNEKFYIGSASISFRRRWTQHRSDLKKQTHRNRYLQSSYNKYGEESFKYEIVEVCDPENCIIREQYYIDTLKPIYNLNPKAESCKGRKLSPESIEKLRQSHLGQPAWNKGKPFSEETRKKMSESAKKKCANPEWKKLASEKLKGRKHPDSYKIIRDDGIVYQNVIEAMQKTGLARHDIYRSCDLNYGLRIRKDGHIYNYLHQVVENTQDTTALDLSKKKE